MRLCKIVLLAQCLVVAPGSATLVPKLLITRRSVAQSGRVSRLGRESPKFESLYSDQITNAE